MVPKIELKSITTFLLCFASLGLSRPSFAQQPVTSSSSQSDLSTPLTDRERMLLDRVTHLEQRIEVLEQKLAKQDATPTPSQQVNSAPQLSPSPSGAAAAETQEARSAQGQPQKPDVLPPPSFLGGTTLNINLDAYYGYNFNDPIGRANLLRTYDVSSNAFSLGQTDLIFDNQPDPASGKRWGFRVDFQYGQATETLQGNPVNEPRPDIYRSIFQAYGTYAIPVKKGTLKVDVGKFSSSLGYEGNYSKDQLNYSRSFWFGFLPFYHMGARVNYTLNDAFAVHYWLVNGTQQTEPFNGYKDESFGFTLTPRKNVSWSLNYYLGQEHPDVMYFPNGGAPAGAPTIQDVPFEPVAHPQKGKLHILDTYLNWQATSKWLFAGELDDEIERLAPSSAPSHTVGGSIYAQYRFTPKLSVAGRAEYLSDRGGLFSGVTQAIKETTVTTKYQLASGFDVFGEWRRDFSNQPFFYTSTLGLLKKEQNTATLGLIWWWGGKEGTW